jgi:small subunit ribosomal protein S3
MTGWKSRWYASKQEFAELLVEDHKIRHSSRTIRQASVPQRRHRPHRDRADAGRGQGVLQVAKPGLIIGKKGQEVELLQEDLQNLIGRRVNLKIDEIHRPEMRAQLVAEDIAGQLGRRASFRRTMKRSMEQTMDAGAKGIKIQLAGRLGGAEMARREKQIMGSIPLSTLRAKIDYGFAEAKTAQGHIGVQVWINQGMYEGEVSMALMPKRVKHRKSQRGRIKGNATRGNKVVFGDFRSPGTPGGWIKAQTIEAGRIAAQQYVRGEGRLYIRIFPHKSDHVDALGNPHGQRQRRTGVLGGGGQAGDGVVRT